MADVFLNIKYNDNGASVIVDKLVTELQKLEQRPVQVRIDTAPLRESAQELSKLTASFEKLKTTSVAFNNSFNGRTVAQSFSDAEKNLTNYERRIENTRRQIQDLFIGTLAKKKLGLFDSSDESNIKSFNEELQNLRNNFNVAKESAKIARLDIERIGAQIDIGGAKKSILELAQELENLSKYGTTNVRQDEAVGRRVSAMLGLSALPSSATTESPQSPRGAYSRYLDYSGLSSHFAEEERRRMEEQKREQEKLLAEQKEKIEKTNAEIALGYHQTWRGIQQVVTGAINSLQSAYNAWKSTVEAPLNLTGVSSLVSMLESMEGSLLLDQITSNISTGFSQGVERYDILQSFPAVMEHIGYSSDDASSAMDRLYQSVLGLPTSFGDIVQNAQFFTLVLDDLDKATDLAIAANNAFVASGANSQQISSGMRQLQYILDGTKLRSTQWYSLIRSMPLALREVGDALGYPDFSSFTADLMGGKIASEELIDTLIDVGLNSEKLGGIIDVMKSRIEATLENVTNAGRRMGESIIESLDSVLRREGGKGLTENIKGVSSIIDHITETATDWIDKNGDKIQALVDKFFDIDWGSIVPSFLEGLINIADRALDNIDTWIDKIGSILEDVNTTINTLEHSRWIKIVSGALSTLPSIAQFFAGVSNIRLGSALVSTGVASGGSLSGVLGTGSVASGLKAIGSVIASHPVIATISATLLGIYGIVAKWDPEEEKKEHDEFVKSEDTRLSTRDFIKEYSSIILGPSARTDEQIYRLNSLRDLIYSSTGGALNLPMLDIDSSIEDFNEAVRLAKEYYSREYFAPSTELGKTLQNRAMDDILANEILGAHESALNLYEEIMRLQEEYDRVTEKYAQRLSAIDERRARISALIEKLQKEGFEWQYKTSADYAGIYGGKDGKDGKFFSEQVKESFGGLFRNTLEDFGKIQAELTPQISELNQKMIDTISGYEGTDAEKSQLLEAWASILGGIDPNDPGSVSRLQTMITEGPSKLIETYLIPTIKSNEALNENRKLLQEAMLEALGLAGGEADAEEDEIFGEMAKDNKIVAIAKALQASLKDMNENYLPSIENGLIDFSNEVVKYIKEAMKRIDELEVVARPTINVLPRLRSPSGETAPAGSVSRSTQQLERLVRQTQPFATGGFAPMGTDTIPAMLTPGEYVQRRAAVQYFGKSFMDRINALDLRGALRSIYTSFATPYATGGFVRSDNRSYRDNHATVNQVFNSSNASTGLRRVSRFVRALN